MKVIKVSLLIILAFAFSRCRQKIDNKKEGEKLMQLSREWSQSASSRDIEKTISYWADDAIVISAGEPMRSGKEEIRKMVEDSYKNPSFKISWQPRSAEVSESGDMGYLIENTKITVNDSIGKPMTIKFNSVTIWKKQSDGTWKNVVDVLSPEQ